MLYLVSAQFLKFHFKHIIWNSYTILNFITLSIRELYFLIYQKNNFFTLPESWCIHVLWVHSFIFTLLALICICCLLLRSVNDIFGSRVMTDTGILLNNQMADFADPENPDTKHSKVIQNYPSLIKSQRAIYDSHVTPLVFSRNFLIYFI